MSTKVNLSEASARKIRSATLLLGVGRPGDGMPRGGMLDPEVGILDKIKFCGTHFQTKFIFEDKQTQKASP